MKRSAWWSVLLVLLLLAAACGGDGGEEQAADGATDEPATEEPATEGAEEPATEGTAAEESATDASCTELEGETISFVVPFSAGARIILHHHGGPELFLEVGRHHPRVRVVPAAGAEGPDETDGLPLQLGAAGVGGRLLRGGALRCRLLGALRGRLLGRGFVCGAVGRLLLPTVATAGRRQQQQDQQH